MGNTMLIGVVLWSHESCVRPRLELSPKPILLTMVPPIKEMRCYESYESYESYEPSKSYDQGDGVR